MITHDEVTHIISSLAKAEFDHLQQIRTFLLILIAQRKGVTGIDLPITVARLAMEAADEIIAKFVENKSCGH